MTGVGKADDEDRTIWSHDGVDIVVNPARRSGRPTLGGTRLEPRIMAERVFQTELQLLPGLTRGEISWDATEDVLDWYRAHPHTPPPVRPTDAGWLLNLPESGVTSERQYLSDRASRAHTYAVSEIASRREYTEAKHIEAMVRYYDAHADDMAVLRRLHYDSTAAVRKFGSRSVGAVTVIGPEDEMDGVIFTEDGDGFRSYPAFLEEQRARDEWPPTDVKYIDHEKTFGVDRPPGLVVSGEDPRGADWR